MAPKSTDRVVPVSKNEPQKRHEGIVDTQVNPPLEADTLLPGLTLASGTGNNPNFIYRGGPVINTPQVFALFVGDWSSTANQNRATRLGQFLTDMMHSQYMNMLAQYGCGSSGTLVNSVFISSTDHDLSATDIQNILQNEINSSTIPEPTNPSNVYLLFLDDATGVNDVAAGATMCESSGNNAFGFHDFFTTTAGNTCVFGVIPGLTDSCLTNSCSSDSGCSLHLSQTQEQRQTQVTSHEFSEMISDPQVGSNEAWSNSGGPHENGDLCNGDSGTITVGANTWTVQEMYSKWDDMNSNGATTCVLGSTNPLPSLLPAVTVILDRSTFGKDEVDALLFTANPGVIDAAFYVAVDGFTPAQLGISSASLSGVPNVAPALTFTPAITGMSCQPDRADRGGPFPGRRYPALYLGLPDQLYQFGRFPGGGGRGNQCAGLGFDLAGHLPGGFRLGQRDLAVDPRAKPIRAGWGYLLAEHRPARFPDQRRRRQIWRDDGQHALRRAHFYPDRDC